MLYSKLKILGKSIKDLADAKLTENDQFHCNKVALNSHKINELVALSKKMDCHKNIGN